MIESSAVLTGTGLRSDYAVVAAYLDYFGKPYTRRSLGDYLEHSNRPSCMTEIADCIAQHGLATTLFNADMNLFNRQLWRKFLAPRDSSGKPILESPASDILETDRVIRKGIRIQRSVVNQTLLDQYLEQEHPILIGYNPAFVHPVEHVFASHAILTKANKEEYTLFEPLREHSTTQFPKNVIIHAIFGTKQDDPSAQSIILGKEPPASIVDQDRELPDKLSCM